MPYSRKEHIRERSELYAPKEGYTIAALDTLVSVIDHPETTDKRLVHNGVTLLGSHGGTIIGHAGERIVKIVGLPPDERKRLTDLINNRPGVFYKLIISGLIPQVPPRKR